MTGQENWGMGRACRKTLSKPMANGNGNGKVGFTSGTAGTRVVVMRTSRGDSFAFATFSDKNRRRSPFNCIRIRTGVPWLSLIDPLRFRKRDIHLAME